MIRKRLFSSLAALPLVLTACAGSHMKPAEPRRATGDLALFAGAPLSAWHVGIADLESSTVLVGASVTVPKPEHPKIPESQVEGMLGTKAINGDALALRWSNAWSADLRLEGGPPLDLRRFVPDGVLEFDLNVKGMAHGGLAFMMNCGSGCERKIPFVKAARAMEGKGWQHLAFSMRCFARDSDSFESVTQPFALDASGTGEVMVANIRLVEHGRPTTACPDYRTVSVTPSPLEEAWSIDWWIPRHQQKLAQIRALQDWHVHSNLVFIGDSITEGWEKDGKAVWAARYSKYAPLNLGFSGDRTENVLWRLQHGELDGLSPKTAVLLIGTNNTGHRQEDPATTAAGVHRILEEMRRRLPSTRILLLAVFPRDELPSSPLRRINEKLNSLLAGFDDGQHIFFLNVNASLMNADGTLSTSVMPDLLHPNENGYNLWAQKMDPLLSRLMAMP